jgi:hypothetical protein
MILIEWRIFKNNNLEQSVINILQALIGREIILTIIKSSLTSLQSWRRITQK